MDSDIENLIRGKLNGLAGLTLADADIVELLTQVANGGGVVHIEVDATRYKLIRREGRFMLTKETRAARASSVPPRR